MDARLAHPNQIITQPAHGQQHNPFRWLQIWNPQAALVTLRDYCETLPSSDPRRGTRSTYKTYMTGMREFLAWSGAILIDGVSAEDFSVSWNTMRMPTHAGISAYVAHLAQRTTQTGERLKPRSINVYLAPVVKFCHYLELQMVTPRSGDEFAFILESQRQFRLVATVKRPPIRRESEHGQMYDTGTRLSLTQVNTIFQSFVPGACDLADITTLRGKRDFLMLYLLFTTGLRRRELTRITLNSIEEAKNTRIIRVLGKRSKQIYVPIDEDAYNAITDLVTTWNDRLDDADPRRIAGDTPLFQPLHGSSDNAMLPVGMANRGAWRYDPRTPIDPSSIGAVVKQRSRAALGFSIQAHDCRRTLAKLMQDEGYSLKDIQLILNHTSPATTEKYIGHGQMNVLHRSRITNKVRFFNPEVRS